MLDPSHGDHFRAPSGRDVADRFEDIRTYVAVVDSGGVNAAAAHLGIAKSAVSRRLGELETRLGVKLIERTTRSFELTALGRDYHRRASEILASLNALDEGLGTGKTTVADITVSIEAGLPPRLLLPAIATFQASEAAAPVRLGVVADPDPRAVDVVVGTAADRKCESRRIGSFRRLLYASPAYLEMHGTPASAAALSDHRRIATASVGDWVVAGRAKARPAAILVVDEIEEALIAATCGIGVAQLPDFVALDAVSRGDLIAILEDSAAAPVEVHASYLRDRSVAVKHFVDALALRTTLSG